MKESRSNQWVRKKKYGEDRKQWIWYYERPFSESAIFRSQAIVEDTNVMEVYYHTKPRFGVDEAASRKNIGRAIKEHLGVGKYITSVDHNNNMSRVSFYCKVDKLPDPERMKAIPRLIDESMVKVDSEKKFTDEL